MKFPCRLDKFLANATGYSRTQVKTFIKQKQIKINSIIASKAQQLVTIDCEVSFNDQIISHLGERYYMLHKPAGYLSTKAEDKHPSALDLIDDLKPEQLHCAGRLDLDTTGLLLITSDGAWSHKVSSPRANKFKAYQVTLAEPISEESLERLRQGVLLRGEDKVTKPARIIAHSPNQIDIFISEGRYHQVKRMFASESNRVVKLHRSAIANITLDPQLKAGESRLLNEEEILGIYS